jgi:hypothetical protein
MNNELDGYGRKWSESNLKYYPSISLKELKKVLKTSVRISVSEMESELGNSRMHKQNFTCLTPDSSN